jgi:hypothetical protein
MPHFARQESGGRRRAERGFVRRERDIGQGSAVDVTGLEPPTFDLELLS